MATAFKTRSTTFWLYDEATRKMKIKASNDPMRVYRRTEMNDKQELKSEVCCNIAYWIKEVLTVAGVIDQDTTEIRLRFEEDDDGQPVLKVQDRVQMNWAIYRHQVAPEALLSGGSISVTGGLDALLYVGVGEGPETDRELIDRLKQEQAQEEVKQPEPKTYPCKHCANPLKPGQEKGTWEHVVKPLFDHSAEPFPGAVEADMKEKSGDDPNEWR